MIASAEKLNNILKSFKINANCVNHSRVRNVSLYDLKLNIGSKIKDINKYSDELSLLLCAKSKPLIKIISEQGIVRLEVVDGEPEKINFFDENNKIDKNNNLSMFLGSTTDGKNLCMDMTKNPHLLIAGSTGSGKSTLLHTIMANMLDDKNIRIFLIDTKNIEFCEYKNAFNNISIVDNYSEAIEILNILLDEMEYRYSLIKNKQISNKFYSNSSEAFPYIILMIDEFADLIMQDDNKLFQTALCKLTQKCRAAGIHCILATQRPSVDVIIGSIKANFPARISCRVASSIDSKVILNTGGAELLSGYGDAIINNYNNLYQRFQIAYTDAEEVCKLLSK